MAPIPNFSDPEEWSEQALNDVEVAARRERARREVLANAPVHADEVATRYLNARDGFIQLISPEVAVSNIVPGYTKPTGAHDAYPIFAVVQINDGDKWRSYKRANMVDLNDPEVRETAWEPVGHITDPMLQRFPTKADIYDDPNREEEWDGNGVSYTMGMTVLYEGIPYVVIADHVSEPNSTPYYSPDLYQMM